MPSQPTTEPLPPDPAWARQSDPLAALDAIASRFLTHGLTTNPADATLWAAAALTAIEVDLGARVARPRRRKAPTP